MQASSTIRTAFAAGRQSFGMWQMLPGANVSRLLARTGVDWVCVDCEHGNIDGLHPSFTPSPKGSALHRIISWVTG